MKKIFLVMMLVIVMICLSSCEKEETNNDNDPKGCDIIDDCADDKDNTYGMTFREAYESYNGKNNSSNKQYRSVNIPEDNPIIQVDAKEIIKKIENKDTFYIYFGDELCPWCRSVIEKALEVAQEAEIEEIYYVEIWDDEGNEILRDKYVIEEGKLLQKIETKADYQKLLDYFADILEEYTLTDENDEIVNVGEKRIYAPNFIYVENGKAIRLTTGISKMQEESDQELNDDILKDEENILEDFFGVNNESNSN